jgi:hypothetical protein
MITPPQILQDWIAFAALALSFGSTIYMYLTAGDRANSGKIKEINDAIAVSDEKIDARVAMLSERLNAHATRIDRVENELRHMPDKDVITELKLAMGDLKGELGKLSVSFAGVQRTVSLIDEHLRTNGGRQ